MTTRASRWTLIAIVLCAATPARAMRNPAAVYCRALGYDYFTTRTPKGVVGLCRLPDGRLVHEWKFFRGQVGLEASYCAQQGYEARALTDGVGCINCVGCVLPGGEVKTVAELMKLNFDESTCGDGACGTMEHHGNCPSDCATGLHDEHCDGEADDTCDPDCPEQNLPDPDCTTNPADGGGAGDGGGASGNDGDGGGGCGCAVDSPPGGQGCAGLLLLFGWAMWRRRRAC